MGRSSGERQHVAEVDGGLGGELVRQPLSMQIAARLASFIEAEGLVPGSVLPSEQKLGERFGVSRPVVREALRTLSGQGIIEIVNGKGGVVRPLDDSALDAFFRRAILIERDASLELMQVRRSLEAQSARLAATRATASDLERMIDTVRAMREHLEDSDAYAELDVRFHLLVAETTGNKMLHRLISSVRVSLHEAILLGLERRVNSRELQQVQDLHEAILNAIVARDADAAATAMLRHLDEAEAAISRQPI